jgi:tetratricopeptide (TPR) repeat protein
MPVRTEETRVSAKDDHLTHDLLLQFLNGQIPAQRFVERCYRHLRATCSICREEFTMAWVAQRSRGQFDLYVKSLLGRTLVLSGELEGVRDVAEGELDALMRLDPHERRMAVAQTTARLRNPFLVTRLIEECRKTIPNDPHQALDLAELALDVAVRVDYRAYGAAFSYDLVAQALAYKGNVLRVLGDLARADQTLLGALSIFKQDKADDDLTQAEIYSFLASLRRDQRRFAEAELFIGEAIRAYRDVEQHRDLAAALTTAASIARRRGETALALTRIHEALGLLDPERDSRLYYYARYNEALYLAESGEFQEAAHLLSKHRTGLERLAERCMDRWLLWLSARIAHGLREFPAAEMAYEEVRRRYVEAGLPFDAAVVSLDLALLYTEAGKPDRVRELATEMLPVFQSREIHREAFATLMLFYEAAQGDTLTVEMLRSLVAHLRRIQGDPERRRR